MICFDVVVEWEVSEVVMMLMRYLRFVKQNKMNIKVGFDVIF